MSTHGVASTKWSFSRPGAPNSNRPYFRTDLRRIAGQQEDWNLPWQDDMYLAYPSAEAPDWNAFIRHVQQLNREADSDNQYKILYVMRRAHNKSSHHRAAHLDGHYHWELTSLPAPTEAKQPEDAPDPGLDEHGRKQCAELREKLARAMHTVGLPPPEMIVTSPLSRALETVDLGVTPLFPSVQPIVLESLGERMTGSARNIRSTNKLIAEHFPAFDVQSVEGSDQLGETYGNPGKTESYEDLWHRVQGALAHVFESSPDSSVVLLMSHCYVEQTLQREITGWDIPVDQRKEAGEFFVGEAGGYAMVVKGQRG